FDDAGGERISVGQLCQGLVQREQAFIRVGRRDAVQSHPASVTAALEASSSTSPIDQDAPHRFGGGGEEVTAIGELLVTNQAQVRLMHQRGGVERLPCLFLTELLRSEFAQLVVDQRQQLVGGVRIALVDGLENVSDVGHNH